MTIKSHISIPMMVLMLGLMLNGCAMSLVKPVDAHSSAIAVHIDFKKLNMLGQPIDSLGHSIYFARLDDQGTVPSMTQWQRATSHRGDTWYLANVQPGYWAVVGAGYIRSGMVVDQKMVAPFPDELVKASKILLPAGKVMYMGSYKVVTSSHGNPVDTTQSYYLDAFLAQEARLTRNDRLGSIAGDFKRGGGMTPATYKALPDDGKRMTAISNMGPDWSGRVAEQ